MILSDPIIAGQPLHIWLGMLTFIFLILQILIGARFLKLPFKLHTRVIWIILLALALVHGFYGFEIYFLK